VGAPADGESPAEGASGTRAPGVEAAARELLPREPTLIEHRPVARPSAPPPVARILLGQGPWAREARLELRGGVLGGTAIHLVSRVGGVEVRLDAASEPARVALAAVIDRVGLQLRSRGIVMRAGRALESGSKERGRGGDARRGT
jgi:hypothetical protein